LSDSSRSSGLLPRGGNCKFCRSYVLWGDVIRGCYRRHQGGKAPRLEESDCEEEDGIEAEAQNDDPVEDSIPTIPVVPAPVKIPRTRVAIGKTVKKRPTSKVPTKRAAPVTNNDSGGENFDIGGFTDLDDSESGVERRPLKRTPTRQRK